MPKETAHGVDCDQNVHRLILAAMGLSRNPCVSGDLGHRDEGVKLARWFPLSPQFHAYCSHLYYEDRNKG